MFIAQCIYSKTREDVRAYMLIPLCMRASESRRQTMYAHRTERTARYSYATEMSHISLTQTLVSKKTRDQLSQFHHIQQEQLSETFGNCLVALDDGSLIP